MHRSLIALLMDDVIWNCALRFLGPISYLTYRPYTFLPHLFLIYISLFLKEIWPLFLSHQEMACYGYPLFMYLRNICSNFLNQSFINVHRLALTNTHIKVTSIVLFQVLHYIILSITRQYGYVFLGMSDSGSVRSSSASPNLGFVPMLSAAAATAMPTTSTAEITPLTATQLQQAIIHLMQVTTAMPLSFITAVICFSLSILPMLFTFFFQYYQCYLLLSLVLLFSFCSRLIQSSSKLYMKLTRW